VGEPGESGLYIPQWLARLTFFFLGRQNQLKKVCLQCREIVRGIPTKAPLLCALLTADLQSVAQLLPGPGPFGEKFRVFVPSLWAMYLVL